MAANLTAASECIRRCIQHREAGKLEAVLKHELTSWLRPIFEGEPDASWVNHYSEGTETTTQLAGEGDRRLTRFIDTLVRATVIEYEADLRSRPKFEEGYRQVREYAAGALRSGVPMTALRGILSDTVDWYAYDATLTPGVDPADCRPEDVQLAVVEELHLEQADEATSARFVEFLRKHLAREQSRSLSASSIASDLGLTSGAYDRHAEPLRQLVDNSRGTDPAARLATDLWSRFVDRIETGAGPFRTSAYVDEAYLAVLARLLCANILSRRALLSDDAELMSILTGRLFEEQFHLRNMVEEDYFGWLWREPVLGTLLPIAGEIQRDLYAYAFDRLLDEDLFGHMLAEVARRSHRKLLGQEGTPRWIATALSERCIELIPAQVKPRILDMCCGSGAILAAVLKTLRTQRADLSADELLRAVCGFDIDPLAVMLAKTTWVVALADEIRGSTEMVAIPIFHADSLFAVTPTTASVPLPEDEDVEVQLDTRRVTLPADLLRSEMLPVFDGIVDWAYDEAGDARERGDARQITPARAATFVQALVERHEIEVTKDQLRAVQVFAHALTSAMAHLAIAGRNGIWAYIIRNTYRPGLLAGQFNGLVSNPPWLALSQLANNPYKEQLSARAAAYGIKPSGAAHLHTELGTTHLLHAIDRYLAPDAAIACLLPGTLLNAQHHAKFRERQYLESERPVGFELREVWDVEPGTFRVRAVAVVGLKRRRAAAVSTNDPTGVLALREGRSVAPLTAVHSGNRTAWLIGEGATGVDLGATDIPIQGADLMPRPAVCVVVEDRRGDEWKVRTPELGDRAHFAVEGAKLLAGVTFAGHVAPVFLHRMAQSLNLLPFALDGHFAGIVIPARRNERRRWELVSPGEMRTAGFTQTARHFQRVDEALEAVRAGKPLASRINERNKLALQDFRPGQFLVLNGAGGGVVCSAVLAVENGSDIVIDQTLYWKAVGSREEAYYRVGLMNSDAITEAIRPLVPEGELGPRHLHTLPNRAIPAFQAGNAQHAEVARLAMELEQQALAILRGDAAINDPAKSIAWRRRKARLALKRLREYERLEAICRELLGIR